MIGILSGVCALLVAWVATRMVLRRKLLPHPCASLPVSAAMSRRFHALRSDESLGEAARWLVETGQHTLPIVDGGAAVGVLTRCDVATGLTHIGADAAIARAPHHAAVTCAPNDTVQGLVGRMAHEPDAIAVVVENGVPVGVLTSEQLSTFIALHGERPAAR